MYYFDMPYIYDTLFVISIWRMESLYYDHLSTFFEMKLGKEQKYQVIMS